MEDILAKKAHASANNLKVPADFSRISRVLSHFLKMTENVLLSCG